MRWYCLLLTTLRCFEIIRAYTNSSSQLLIVEIQWKRFSEFYPIVMNNEEISSKLYSNVSGTLFHNKSYIHHKSYFKTVAWNHKQMRSPLLNLILLEILMELEPPPIFPWDFYNSDFFQRKPCHLVLAMACFSIFIDCSSIWFVVV